jgi:hypothetical protein
MTLRIFRVIVAALTLTAFCAFKTHAAPKTPANVEGMLEEAYADLDRADHDYKGHRKAAMQQIEEAGKLLKLNLGGDGKGHEKQGVSDEQLRAAESVLNQAKGELKGEKHSKVLHHVNKALEELHAALKVK